MCLPIFLKIGTRTNYTIHDVPNILLSVMLISFSPCVNIFTQISVVVLKQDVNPTEIPTEGILLLAHHLF